MRSDDLIYVVAVVDFISDKYMNVVYMSFSWQKASSVSKRDVIIPSMLMCFYAVILKSTAIVTCEINYFMNLLCLLKIL